VIAAGVVLALLASIGLLAVAGRNSARRSLRSVVTGALGDAEHKLSQIFSSPQTPASGATTDVASTPRKSAVARPVRAFPANRSEGASEPPAAPALFETTPPAAKRLEDRFAAVASPPLVTLPKPFVDFEPLTNIVIVATSGSSSDPAPDKPVYSSSDAAVRPPVPLRPQLPTLPTPTSRTSYYEILVDENGAAQSVRVISPVRRYYDGMLVAAAKAWKFKPATRDGRPVKCWIRIPINVADGGQ
jgi:TonB family protein